ncbi:hypothetical protein [Marinivivus vitaminiproducens]|uniref:hypothetical protein n=1 Tax=Marinivivus vitaminiproducens TaxID=3035935 RepID=UPI0027AB12C2|nr:hypothetical protein P4R82_23380 [Geminicoccaceae bacterium SCSIO 64248]
MLATISLAALFALGVLKFPVWLIAPLAVLNTFLGMHHRPGRAEMLWHRGGYGFVLLTTLPRQLTLAAFLFFVGFGIRAAWDSM